MTTVVSLCHFSKERSKKMVATYEKTLYENGDFSICSFRPFSETDVPQGGLSKYGNFVGTGYDLPHDSELSLNLEGEWENSKYGLQLKVTAWVTILPKTEEGILAFLSSGVLPFVKKRMARRLYDKFGKQIFSVIENTPERLLEVNGISEKKLKAITEAYTVNYGYQDLLMLLQPAGISVSKIKKIVDKFGTAATEKVKANPYVLFTISGFGFKTVDEIAQKTHTPLNDPLRIMGALKFVLIEAQNNGHLCMEQGELRKEAHKMLNEGFEDEKVSLNEVTSVIVKMASEGALKGDNGYAYLAANFDNEVFAAERTRGFLGIHEEEIDVAPNIESFENSNFPLAERQKEAIRQFFGNRLSIITGGPGTGKSTVLKAILEIVYSLNEYADVMLLAPTGKAARRMAEATGYAASTIHSGLHINETTKREDIETLKADVVIVDEVSMCDMKLYALLMAAVDPMSTKLLLVGDSDQLPSVGAGNVLNELITCGKVPVTRLDLVYRQGAGSLIPVNADKINNGVSKLTYGADFQFVPTDDTEVCFNTVIDRYLKEVSRIGIENCCILCPMRSKGLNSVNEYNRQIQSVINPPSSDKQEIKLRNTTLREGDRVMQTKNSEDVSNGETGVIVKIEKDEDEIPVCGIRFDGKTELLWYYPDDLINITLAYSITIHKSQGSEYQSVIMPFLKSFYIMLKRNLLYTAVTRAKSRVVIVGQRQAIHMAVNKTETDKRNTQLGKRI